ncbi:MarR family transcriptional regulator, partial [Enterococcus cecorum]|nr:MarR family transcriptional regulator [Enterococcus cecorum]
MLNEFYVLYFLNQSQGQSLTVSDLSEKIGISISATPRVLVKYEESWRVIEQKAGEDKREVQGS